ncbi:MAG: DUF4270 domain-containing protein [Bacteroidaceae bacterium]|nr:DUF4270 domain-containing protein [Bacteroidaceae bacterium]
MHTIKIGKLLPLVLLAFAACDDNTENIGIHSESDGITNSLAVFQLTTRSLKLDSVVANSTISYLGDITDPETGTDIRADFAAQFYTFEDYEFPDKSQMVGDVDGKVRQGIVQCDSCEVRLYFDKYYGDGNNPMKLEVYELSSEKLLEEDSVYYTNVDLTKFLPAGSAPLSTRIFTPRDFNQSSATLNGSDYNDNVRVVLPREVGQRIMERYYENPTNYKDSYHFIRNVFPGFYFRTSGGKGTMLSVYVGTMNVYYRYADKTEAGKDTVYNAITRFAATPEVIQSTRFENQNMAPLLADNSCTYLKTPAGICTEMTLPVDQLFTGEHATDSISLASVTLTRYNKPQDSYQLGTPGTLLMVRKQDMYSFFDEHRVADGRTSYTTTFNTIYNTYTFDNICRLLAYCRHEKLAGAAEAGITEEEWASRHPDWNKVVLIPVTTSYATVNRNNSTVTALVSVNHDLNLNSVRLVGGSSSPLTMQVVYSKFY